MRGGGGGGRRKIKKQGTARARARQDRRNSVMAEIDNAILSFMSTKQKQTHHRFVNETTEQRHNRFNLAAMYMIDAMYDHDINHNSDPRSIHIYHFLYSGKRWWKIVSWAIVIQLFNTLFEKPAVFTDVSFTIPLLIELCCILVQFADVLLRFLLTTKHARFSHKWYNAKCFVVLAMLVDWICAASLGPDSTRFSR